MRGRPIAALRPISLARALPAQCRSSTGFNTPLKKVSAARLSARSSSSNALDFHRLNGRVRKMTPLSIENAMAGFFQRPSKGLFLLRLAPVRSEQNVPNMSGPTKTSSGT